MSSILKPTYLEKPEQYGLFSISFTVNSQYKTSADNDSFIYYRVRHLIGCLEMLPNNYTMKDCRKASHKALFTASVRSKVKVIIKLVK